MSFVRVLMFLVVLVVFSLSVASANAEKSLTSSEELWKTSSKENAKIVLEDTSTVVQQLDCDCSAHATKCTLDNGKKICTCPDGYSEFGGRCRECDCGNYADKCTFENGTKICTCLDGYAEFGGRCRECDCSYHEKKCSFVFGRIFCQCKDTHKDKSGTCNVCMCGDYANNCTFVKDEKVCNCLDGYADALGWCRKCGDCGANGKCIFNYNYEKACKCNDGYSEYKGTCKECNCGNNSICTLGHDEQKNCSCKTGYEMFQGNCEECNCENNSICTFGLGGQKKCSCKTGYKMFKGNCKQICDSTKCKNGQCEITGQTFICICDEGFTGMLCDKEVTKNEGSLATIMNGYVLLYIAIPFSLVAFFLGVYKGMRTKKVDKVKSDSAI